MRLKSVSGAQKRSQEKQMAGSAATDASLSLALTAAALSAAVTARWMQWRQQKGHCNVSKHPC
jgi:hypothetical protein